MNDGELLQQLKRVIRYVPETGKFYWLVNRGSVAAGHEAGHTSVTCSRKKMTIRVLGRSYAAGRLAWFLMTGRFPNYQIDHINRNPLDNHWENLREATHSQNQMNRAVRRGSGTGLKGVKEIKNRHNTRYKAGICKGGKRIHLGHFGTADQAFAAYKKAAVQVHDEFASW